MRADFAVLILTHGRPDTVHTVKTLKTCGYTGRTILVVDNQDKTVDRYIANFGSENVVIFDKNEYIKQTDSGNNFGDYRAVVYARNAAFDIARDLGLKFFLVLDDDYKYFRYRMHNYYGFVASVKNIDKTFESMITFLENTPTMTIAFSQGGDHIGGFQGVKMKRKAMNSFFCRTDRPFKFMGTINEDVNAYVTLGSRGDLFMTLTAIQVDQIQTQKNKAGLTDIYLALGTYVKSFLTTMMHPSSAKVTMMQSGLNRIHHSIKWSNTVPMIIDESYKKTEAKS